MTLTIKHGCQTAYKDYAGPPTVAQIKQDQNLKMELGFGDNVRVLVNDVEQPNHVSVQGGTVIIETAANTKAR